MNSALVDIVVTNTINPLAGAIFSGDSLPAWAVGAPLDASPIAIVDDDQWVLRSMGRLIKSAGFRVETFLTAEDFLEYARDSKTVCAILDIGLPGMSGLDLQERLALENPQIRVIFVSAHDETEMRTRALAAGAIAFLGKPVNDKALLDAISSAVK
jgi:FixJ family two-component response regulator